MTARPKWTFLTNHGAVLLIVAQNPRFTLREIAAAAGITERSVSSIIADLESAGYIASQKVGRNKRYELDLEMPLRHPVVAVRNVSDLLKALDGELDRLEGDRE